MREREHLEELGVYGQILLKWVSNKWDREAITGFTWLMIQRIGGLL